MSIELRVLTGARAGHGARFDGAAVTLGRDPRSDLPLDPHRDLDVSSRHAMLRRTPDGRVTVEDLGSTNGTFVNGTRVGTHELRDGDVLQLGAEGPKVEVRIGTPPTVTAGGAPRGATTRVAIAVRAERARLRRGVWWGGAVLAVGIAGAYLLGARRSADDVAELERLVAGHGAITDSLQRQLRGVADSSVIALLRQESDSLRLVAQAGSPDDRAGVRDAVARRRTGAEALVAMDLPAINARNAPGVAYVVAEVDGRPLAGTAFAVSHDGALVTNRHLVRSASGARATRIAVKFRDERTWRSAHVVRIATGETDDLALLQLDGDPRVPAVLDIAPAATTLPEGAAVATIGFPLGRATMMEGDGDDFVAKTSLYPGTVSKQLADVVQIATFAGSGSSGSPVLDARGQVVGVIWGGPRESQGRIAYAVPAARIATLLRGD